VNEYHLDPELLHEAMASIAEARPEERATWEGWRDVALRAVLAFGLSGEVADIATMSIQFRYSALARLFRAGGGQGFSTPANPGTRNLDGAIVRCAAEEPLLERDGPVSFDVESFDRRLLRLASPVGRA
jgi:hypothetical protein